MIKDPFFLVLVLLAIELMVLWLSKRTCLAKIFDFLPSVFWIYFLPMLASSSGLIDPKAEIYSMITSYLLPMALFLLLMTVEIKSILRLGPMALGMFFIGAIGIVCGMVVVFILFKGVVGSEYWAGFAALCASWTGGSANMIAVKEALKIPDAVFLPMVIVDTVIPYVWMAILMASVGFASRLDRFNRADRLVIDQLALRINQASALNQRRLQLRCTLGILVLALLGALVSILISQHLPVINGVVSCYAWTIIVVSFLAILLSMTPVRKLESYGTNQVGYFILYFVLTAIGAKASLGQMSHILLLLAAGFLVVMIHAIILLMAARILHVPVFLVAVASQANVGGVASAPVVAELYQKGFASVGLLLAILGNILGTYIGILTGQILRQLG